MKAEKPFDCVAYKRAVQEKHAAESRNLSAEEKLRRRKEWLDKSDNPAARVWREMGRKKEALHARRKGAS